MCADMIYLINTEDNFYIKLVRNHIKFLESFLTVVEISKCMSLQITAYNWFQVFSSYVSIVSMVIFVGTFKTIMTRYKIWIRLFPKIIYIQTIK